VGSRFSRSVNLPRFIYIPFVSVFEMLNYCFVLPYLPEVAELAKKFVRKMVMVKNTTTSTELRVSLAITFGFNAVHQGIVEFLILK
jgi:hypothetical protein